MSGRILVIDDVPTNRALLKAKLTSAYYEVLTHGTSENALETVKSHQPDIVLLDVKMPGKDGNEVCKELKEDPETSHIPVVMVTSCESPNERIAGLEAGADDFLSKPFDDVTLFARVRNLMRDKLMFDEMRLRDDTSRELGLSGAFDVDKEELAGVGNIVLAASSPSESYMWKSILGTHLNVNIQEADGCDSTLNLAKESEQDLFVIHQAVMDGTGGLRLVSALRARPETRQAAIIFVVNDDDAKAAAIALDLGASDYVVSALDPNEFVVRVRSQLRRKRYSDRLRANVIDGLKLAVIDPLTGLYNRRYAERHLKSIVERSTEEGNPFSVLMLDLDEFKSVNTRFGHKAGDAVLKEFAGRIQENVRGIDLVARIGGEEFCVVMPGTEVERASDVAERLRQTIDGKPFLSMRSGFDPVHVTVSIGVSTSDALSQDMDRVFDEADEALFQAKDGGRNAVKVSSAAA